MILQTKYFGEMDFKESDVVHFSYGLPGFEGVKKYVLIHNDEEGSPFKWLQGVDEPKLAFVIIDPFLAKKNYEIKLENETLKDLDIKDAKEVAVYCIVVVPEDINKMTMNLQAPLIINTANNKGRQLILDTDRYGVRHYIVEELQGREGTENACTDKEKGSIHCNKSKY